MPELETVKLSYAAAIDEAIAVAMRTDETVFVLGTNPPPKLVAEFGAERVRRLPISEALFTGMAVGAAACGTRPVVLWRNVTFSFVAFDQLVNQAAKLRYMSGGQRAFPITFLCYGSGGLRIAAQHSQSPYAMFAQVPGLRVNAPADPADAFELVLAGIREDDPTVCFTTSRLDPVEQEFIPVEAPPGSPSATVRVAGADATVVTMAGCVSMVEAALPGLAAEGVDVELIDLRSLAPLDAESVRASVRKTGRLVVVDEAPARCSVAAEVIALVSEDPETSAALRRPPIRVCGADVPIPYAGVLEDAVLPQAEQVVAAVRQATGLAPRRGDG
jgi:pyruvate dehydrogenase E1 component beta subunit